MTSALFDEAGYCRLHKEKLTSLTLYVHCSMKDVDPRSWIRFVSSVQIPADSTWTRHSGKEAKIQITRHEFLNFIYLYTRVIRRQCCDI